MTEDEARNLVVEKLKAKGAQGITVENVVLGENNVHVHVVYREKVHGATSMVRKDIMILRMAGRWTALI